MSETVTLRNKKTGETVTLRRKGSESFSEKIQGGVKKSEEAYNLIKTPSVNPALETAKEGFRGTMEQGTKSFMPEWMPTLPGGGLTASLGPNVAMAIPPQFQRQAQREMMSPFGMAGLIGGVLGTSAGKAAEGVGALKGSIGEYRQAGKGLEKLGEGLGVSKSQIPEKLEQLAEIKKDELTSHVNSFKEALNSFKDKGALETKPKIAKFGENLSKTYDSKIDQVDDILSKSDDPVNITKMDVAKDWIERAINRLSGHPKEQYRLASAVKKMGYEALPGAAADEYGNVIWNVLPDNPESALNFRDLIKHKNEIGGLGGNASSAAKHSFVDFLSDESKFPFNVSDIYKEMQKGYGPLADAKWQAYKIFKPFDKANIDTKAAASFFDRVAKDSLRSGEQRLLNLIEGGSDFAPGVGDISSAMRKFGLEARQKKVNLSREVNDIMENAKQARDYLAQRKKMQDNIKKIVGLFGIGAVGEEAVRRTMFR